MPISACPEHGQPPTGSAVFGVSGPDDRARIPRRRLAALAAAQRAEIHVGVSDDTLRDLATRYRAPAPVLAAGCAACGCPCATGDGCGCTCCCSYEPAVTGTGARS